MLLAALAAGCAGPTAGPTAGQTGPEAPAPPEASTESPAAEPAPSPAVPAPAAGWQTHAAPIEVTLHNGLFLDDVRAWIISHQGGQVLRTVDGGVTWQTAATLGEGFLETIHFVDAGRGFLVGDGGRLLATSDGGATWRPALQAPAEIAFYGLVFFTPEHGFAGGVDTAQRRGRMFETRDGGSTWQPEPGVTAGIHRLIAGAGRLWAVGEDGALLSRPLP
jgi:photosystem II stability/assembly factor-like uncharacterized protein